MNIFHLDEDPVKCAHYHNNRHSIKMLLESAQLLCNKFNRQDIKAPYKLTHKNHPCSLWMDGQQNFEWTLNLSEELCKEFIFRREKPHKTQGVIEWCRANKDKLQFSFAQSDPPLCIPCKYKIGGAVESYRAYYVGAKRFDRAGRRMDVWFPRERPHWYV